MDQPATLHPATAREIILEVVRNMREGLEPLHYSTLAPAIYHVYLHTDDLDRLRGIAPRIVDEAKRALDAEVEKLNQGSLADRLKEKLHKRNEPKIAIPDGGWQMQLLENTDEDAQAGDIVIYSELALPSKADLGAGAMTKRIATRRMGGAETAKTTFEPAAVAPEAAAQPNSGQAPPSVYATIEYEDGSGRRTYRMTKDEIVVGRGGRDYWTDL